MEKTDINQLFEAYIQGNYTKADLDQLLAAISEGRLSEDQLSRVFEQGEDSNGIDLLVVDHIAANIERRLKIAIQPPKTRKISWIAYAAALVLSLGVSLYFYINRSDKGGTAQEIVSVADVVPGTNRAILKSDKGTLINLDEEKGKIYSKDGKISYEDGQSVATDIAQHFTLETPRAGQYQAVLPDGSKVWLNAASSVSFPKAFSATERVVEITGEVYFEVAHETNRPFKVRMNGQQITVKGTSFNIHAYKDEQTTYTTLVTGRVEVATTSGKKLQLVPGQVLSNNGAAPQITNANLEVALAWKNGYFLFDKEPLTNVMKQISRWYDVDVTYASGELVDEVFGGSISRSKNLREVLDILQTTGDVRFTIDNNTVTVYRKRTK